MGHPKKHRRKYTSPPHPWQASRIEEERILFQEYGLKNKKELWKMGSMTKRFRDQAKRLIADTTEQGIKEKNQLIARLDKLNLIQSNAIEDVLNLTVKDLLERRLQTFVYKKNLAKTINQARQFIVHGHIKVGENKVNVPSYLVTKEEEASITFLQKSNLSSEDHPERLKKETKKVKKEEKKESNKEKPKKEVKEDGKEKERKTAPKQ